MPAAVSRAMRWAAGSFVFFRADAFRALGGFSTELFASEEGLGFMLIRAMEAHKVVDIMALAFMLFAAATAIGGVLLAVEHRVHR